MNFDDETLYSLLPAIYRIRDGERGEPLLQLLGVIADEVRALEENLDQLYDDLFIETCAEWAVPYIGDALGAGLLTPGEGSSLRAYVANSIAYRRRKGTAAVLEQLARDITRWPAHAVEFFQALARTQHLAHVRDGGGTADLRDRNALDLLGTPFSRLAHTAEVRRIGSGRGRFNIPHIGIFLWRLTPYQMLRAPARGSRGLYHFSTLGTDLPLFSLPSTEEDISRISGEEHVPGAIRPGALEDDLREFMARSDSRPDTGWPGRSRLYGEGCALAVYRDGRLVPASAIVVADLSAWERPGPGKVAIDPERGRLAFPDGGSPAQVEVSYCYGFSADMGGGPYPRQRAADPDACVIRVSKNGACTTLQEARDRCLDIGESEGRRVLVIRVEDNGVYGGNFDIDLPPETAVTIEAGEGCRPTWRPVGNNVIRGAEGSSFSLDGFLVEGGLQIAGSPDIRITHTTLVPGWSLNQDGSPRYPRANSLQTSDASDRPGVTIHRSICGPLRIPADARPLTVSESILDAPPEDGSYPAVAGWESGEGPKAVMERCTVFGQVCVAELEASDSIFLIDVTVERRQAGCIRFSYVPGASRTPRRYRCQPDLSLEAARTAGDRTEQQIAALEAARRPAFTRRRYGRPGYAQLSAACSPDILTGAQNGSEMGAFNRLFQADRESNLRRVIDEYIRFGFEAGIFYVS